MKEPTFDREGYPTNGTIGAIIRWRYDDPVGWIQFCIAAWDKHYGVVRIKPAKIEFVTGGWSGNEEIVSAMRGHFVLWAMLWESSHRGGLEVLRNPERRTV